MPCVMTLFRPGPKTGRRADRDRHGRAAALAVPFQLLKFDVSPAGQFLQGRADVLGVKALAHRAQQRKSVISKTRGAK